MKCVGIVLLGLRLYPLLVGRLCLRLRRQGPRLLRRLHRQTIAAEIVGRRVRHPRIGHAARRLGSQLLGRRLLLVVGLRLRHGRWRRRERLALYRLRRRLQVLLLRRLSKRGKRGGRSRGPRRLRLRI